MQSSLFVPDHAFIQRLLLQGILHHMQNKDSLLTFSLILLGLPLSQQAQASHRHTC